MSQIIARDARVCIINNGFKSGYLYLHNGMRQGNPFSPYLHVIAVEVLALNIINNNTKKDKKIDGGEIKIYQYAEIYKLYFLSDINSVKEVFAFLILFNLFPGLELNITKTQTIRIG